MYDSIVTRPATWADLPACLEVEHAAMKANHYLADVADLYFNGTVGDLTVAEVDGKIVGIGKLTLLYDGSAWLETLRVDPAYQGNGVGKAIYRRYLEEAAELNAPALRMYTGVKNAVSAGLARRHGFTIHCTCREMTLRLDDSPILETRFHRVGQDTACRLLAPLADAWRGFLCFNRTFYAMNEPLYRGLAYEGKVYREEASCSILVAGTRFQHKKALHVALVEGDVDRCIAAAKTIARERGIPQLTVMFPYDNQVLEEKLASLGFETAPSDFISMGMYR